MTYIVTDPVSVHEIVVSAFISPQSIEETLNNLCEASKSVSYGKKDIEVCQFVERLFYKVYKGCRAIPFGSRVSGLASSDSDLDVFLDTGNNNNNNNLCIEIQRMWNLKYTIVPLIIGATGIVTRSLKKNLETMPGNHSIDSLQKTAILGTSHIIRKVLQCEA